MDKDTIKYYEDMFQMFETPGWKQLVVEADGHVNSLKDKLAVEFDTTLSNYIRGQLAQLNYMVNFEDIARSTYEQALEEDDSAPL